MPAATQRLEDCRRRYPEVFDRPWRSRLLGPAVFLAFVALTVYCLIRFDFSPARLADGVQHLGIVVVQMVPPSPGESPGEILWAILETLAMAFLGTLMASLLAVPLSILAARNTFPFRLPRFFLRRGLDGLRGVDQLIWALIFVRAVGLGPLAGIMAITLSDTGTLAKLFSESVDNIDRRQIDGVTATGGNLLQTLRFAVLPQVLPMYLSSALYLFESNVRSATILGIVGAGGIGFQLSDRIRAHHWEEASFILILILITVAVIDNLSRRLRMRIIANSGSGAEDRSPRAAS